MLGAGGDSTIWALALEFLDWLGSKGEYYLEADLDSWPPLRYEPADCGSPFFLPRLCRYLELSRGAVAIVHGYGLHLLRPTPEGRVKVQLVEVPYAFSDAINSVDARFTSWLSWPPFDSESRFSLRLNEVRAAILAHAL